MRLVRPYFMGTPSAVLTVTSETESQKIAESACAPTRGPASSLTPARPSVAVAVSASMNTASWTGTGSSPRQSWVRAVALRHPREGFPPFREVGQLVGSFGQHFVDQRSRVPVESAVDPPPRLIQ